MDLIGHTSWADFFTRSITRGTLHHAYLIVGPPGSGKTTLATAVAAALLKVNSSSLPSHPDIQLVARLVDEKTGKQKKDISIEQIRDVVQFVQETSFYQGGYRIVMVSEADHLSRSGANALLKTLEEPTDRTILFLLAHDESKILPTIVSRCHRVGLRPVSEAALLNYAESQGLDQNKAWPLIKAAAGRPGLLISWLKDWESWQAYEAEINQWITDRQQPLSQQWAMVETVVHETAGEDARERCRQWITTGFAALHHSTIDAVGTIRLNRQQVVRLARALERAKRGLQNNVTPRLLVESVCLSLFA